VPLISLSYSMQIAYLVSFAIVIHVTLFGCQGAHGAAHGTFPEQVVPWKLDTEDDLRHSEKIWVVFLRLGVISTTRTVGVEHRMFSLERRWSSRTFRYGYLVTTSPPLPSTPSAPPSLSG